MKKIVFLRKFFFGSLFAYEKSKNKKFNYILVELFFIKAKKKINSYKLKFPKNTKVYLILYILVLKLRDLKMPVNTYIEHISFFNLQK